jgi:hypothetical protein
MIMKTSVYLMLGIVLAGCVHAQDFHDWKANIKVVDETGLPVKGTSVTVFYDPISQDTNVDLGKITGFTDTEGAFTASHHDRTYGLRFLVEKEGYYSTDINDDFHGVFSPEKLNRNLNFVLKKVGKPTAMYAKRINSLTVPAFNRAIGYDLMIGDWVGPYGKGINADLFFTEKHTDPQSGYILSISFPKPGDGIQEFTVPDAEKGSGLRSSHEAPVGSYQPEAAQTEMTNPSRNFYFRVRTKLDENGNVVSARYGKIYGDLAQFIYYFNPTPNDRNVEFDPKQNLLGGIQSFEQVSQP